MYAIGLADQMAKKDSEMLSFFVLKTYRFRKIIAISPQYSFHQPSQ